MTVAATSCTTARRSSGAIAAAADAGGEDERVAGAHARVSLGQPQHVQHLHSGRLSCRT
jgi:hypothetical protein